MHEVAGRNLLGSMGDALHILRDVSQQILFSERGQQGADDGERHTFTRYTSRVEKSQWPCQRAPWEQRLMRKLLTEEGAA